MSNVVVPLVDNSISFWSFHTTMPTTVTKIFNLTYNLIKKKTIDWYYIYFIKIKMDKMKKLNILTALTIFAISMQCFRTLVLFRPRESYSSLSATNNNSRNEEFSFVLYGSLKISNSFVDDERFNYKLWNKIQLICNVIALFNIYEIV